MVMPSWQVCESLAVSAGSQEKGAIGAMFEREMKQEKNLEVRVPFMFLLMDIGALDPEWHSLFIVDERLSFAEGTPGVNMMESSET